MCLQPRPSKSRLRRPPRRHPRLRKLRLRPHPRRLGRVARIGNRAHRSWAFTGREHAIAREASAYRKSRGHRIGRDLSRGTGDHGEEARQQQPDAVEYRWPRARLGCVCGLGCIFLAQQPGAVVSVRGVDVQSEGDKVVLNGTAPNKEVAEQAFEDGRQLLQGSGEWVAGCAATAMRDR